MKSGPDDDRTAAIFLKIGNPNTLYRVDAILSAKAIMSPGVSIRTSFLPVLIAPTI